MPVNVEWSKLVNPVLAFVYLLLLIFIGINCFTMLYQFILHSKVNQLYRYIYIFLYIFYTHTHTHPFLDFFPI